MQQYKQYIPDGPDIPEEIEHARRNNELVLFCGAGISAQNGLPLFKDLVEQVCQKLSIDIEKNPILKTAWDSKQYDSVLDLVEGNEPFSVSREILRKEVIKILKRREEDTETDTKISTGTEIGAKTGESTETGTNKSNKRNTRNNQVGNGAHKALLDLSALPDNKGYRLVTTNFDKLFFKADLDPALSDSAPKLAPPRKETWKNLTFLHGVIDEKHDPEGSNLILTRKDFGLAYLHDNWAARFVIQLFQDFTVLFIGYGVNDPVMNYLVSAISYENQRRKQNDNKTNSVPESSNKNNNENKIKPSIYAFAGYGKDGEKEVKKEQAESEWKSIGVEPIPYKIKNNNDHSILYDTIKKWAEWKKTGLAGRKNWLEEQLKSPYKESDKLEARNIISFLKTDKKLAEYLPRINFELKEIQENTPRENKPPENVKGKVITDTNLDPTQKNQHNPVDIRWLKPFRENGLLDKLTNKTATPVTPVLQMPLWENLSLTEYHITNWLLHHLDKKELIHWVIDRGCLLHPLFKYMIRKEMYYRERTKALYSPLDKRIWLFWEIITNNNYLTYQPVWEYDIDYDIIENLNNKKYCSIKAQKLLEALKPYIYFQRGVSGSFLKENPEFKDTTYDVELKINASHYPNVELTDKKTLLLHAEDFSNLLKQAMELAKTFEIIKNGEDSFYITRPSIDIQNNRYNPWTYLIDLVKESFDLAMQKDKPLAKFLLNKWRFYPYSVFYRLILYAITKHPELEENIALDLLESNPAHTLWSRTSQNEVFKYLRHRKHSVKAFEQLVALIMEGPPRSLFKENIDENIFIEWKERDTFHRLDCLKENKNLFPEEINTYYNKIQKKYSLKSSKNNQHDLSYFQTSAVFVSGQKRYHNLIPQQIFDDLKNPKSTHWPGEKEREFCSLAKDKPDKAFEVLLKFPAQDMESAIYWGAFLSGIAELSNMQKISDIQKSIQYFEKALEKIENQNDELIKKYLGSLIYAWDLKAGPIYIKNKKYFEKWWSRLWNLSIQDTTDFESDDSNFSMNALNSKMGKLSESIFHALWSKFDKTIPRNDKIPEEIKNYFNTIIKTGATKNPSVMFHFGSDLYKLWFLDRDWTKATLKPLMDWKKNKNISRALWEGYTYHMNLSPDFLADFKAEFYKLFLKRKSLYKTGSDHYENQNRCLAVADLFLIATGGKWYTNIFTTEETKQLKQILDTDLLKSLAIKIRELLKKSGDKSSSLWTKEIKPWIEKFWPYQNNMKTQEIAEDLSFVILYCGDKLSDSFELLKDKIEKVITKNHYSIIHHIAKSIKNNEKQLDNYQELLNFLKWNLPELDTIYSFHSEKLKTILDKIKSKYPEIENNEAYTTLLEKIP